MIYGFEFLREFNSKAEDAAKNSRIELENYHKEFSLERGNGIPGKITMHSFVLQCLRCFHYISTSTETAKKPSLHAIDFLKLPKTDQNLSALISLSKNDGIHLA